MSKSTFEIDHMLARASLRDSADGLELSDAIREFVNAPCAKNERALKRFGVRVVRGADR